MLMLYEANHAGQYRVGYIWSPKFKKGTQDNLGQLVWDGSSCEVLETVNVTDDPALSGNTLTTVSAGQTQVIFLTRYRIHMSCISCIGRWILYHHTTWGALPLLTLTLNSLI